ncbi:MAG: GNAT family N-acetyltransferase [Balneolaceae bacterium]
MKIEPVMTGVTFVSTDEEKKKFLRFPYHHYNGDDYWVPPLLAEQKKLVDVKRNPFYKNAEAAFFLAEQNGETAGRIAAIVDHRYNDFHKTRTGFFGFFESNDSQEVTDLLLRVATDWLKIKGMDNLLGPSNPGMMDEIGILVDGFDEYPYILMPYHKPYYDRLLTSARLEKAMDLYAYEVDQDTVNRDRMKRAAGIVKKRIPGLVIREINLRRIKSEVKIIRHIFNEAWQRNWGFIPLTQGELDVLAKDLKTIVNTKFAHIAEIDGEPVAFSVALPDYNQVFRKMDGRLFPFGIFQLLYNRRKINRIRTALMGVLPAYRGKGIDALLHQKSIDNGLEVGMHTSELSWILESNVEMIRIAEKIGGSKTKTYRMYRKDF